MIWPPLLGLLGRRQGRSHSVMGGRWWLPRSARFAVTVAVSQLVSSVVIDVAERWAVHCGAPRSGAASIPGTARSGWSVKGSSRPRPVSRPGTG